MKQKKKIHNPTPPRKPTRKKEPDDSAPIAVRLAHKPGESPAVPRNPETGWRDTYMKGRAFVVDPTDEEIEEAELQVMSDCVHTKGLSAPELRFAVLYTMSDPNKSLRQMAAESGIDPKKTKALLNRPDVAKALVEIAQRLCDKSSQRLVVGVSKLVDNLATKLLSGEIESLDRGQTYLVELALRRCGISKHSTTPKKQGGNMNVNVQGNAGIVVCDPNDPTKQKDLSEIMAKLQKDTGKPLDDVAAAPSKPAKKKARRKTNAPG